MQFDIGDEGILSDRTLIYSSHSGITLLQVLRLEVP